MSVFAAIAALLTLLVLGAVLWPLWRPSRGLYMGAVMALGIGAMALYRMLGTPAAIEMTNAAPVAGAEQAGMPANMDDAIKQLEDALAKHPDEVEGWRLLGRSYLGVERYADARKAFERALSLSPDDADVMVEAAQSRLYADPQKQLDAEGVALLERALKTQPQHQRARWFLGVAQRQQGKPAEAAATWEPLLAQVQGGTATTLRTQINEARKEAGLKPLAEPAPVATNANTLLRVQVDIAPELKARLTGQEILFVFARQAGGPPMPVAAKRLPVSASSFPMTLEFSDDDSPMPTLKLSQLPQVELAARISKAGDVMAKSGDFEAEALQAKTGTQQDYTLRIERAVP